MDEGGDKDVVSSKSKATLIFGWIAVILHMVFYVFMLFFALFSFWYAAGTPWGLMYAIFLVPIVFQAAWLFPSHFLKGRGDVVWWLYVLNGVGLIHALALGLTFWIINMVLSFGLVVACVRDNQDNFDAFEAEICNKDGWVFLWLQIGAFIVGGLLPLVAAVAHGFGLFDARSPQGSGSALQFWGKSPESKDAFRFDPHSV